MNYQPVITLCFWRREEYAERVMQHLAACDGIDKYHLIFVLDGPPRHSMLQLVRNSKLGASRRVIQSQKNLGCNGNTRRALGAGFARSNYVIHVEEDVTLAPDALFYFEWARQFEHDKSIISVGAWRHPHGWLPSHGPYPSSERIQTKVSRHPGCWIWGFATWFDRWEDMDTHWTNGNDQSLSWDTCWTRHRARTNRVGIIPWVSRAQNIGARDGVHRGDSINEYWAGAHGFKRDLNFQLVGPPPKP